MKNPFKILLILGAGVIIGFLFFNSKNASVSENKKTFAGVDLSNATQITCTYPQVLNAVYNNGEISHELPPPETNPMIFTFSKLDDPQTGQLSYIDATQTITTIPVIKLVDNKDKIIYLEGDGESYLTVHSIYKKTGVSTYSKNINFIGMIPEVASAMGSCVNY